MPKRKSTSANSVVSDATEAMGQAIGKAMAALDSVVTRKKRRPNGYERLAEKRQQATAHDRPRRRKPAARAKTAATSRRRSTASRARKAK